MSDITTPSESVKRTPSRETTEGIRDKYQEVLDAQHKAVIKTVEFGKMLIRVKEESPHGFFGSYIDSNFSFSHRTAQRWMKLASDFSKLTPAEATALSHLTVEEATRAISRASSTAAGIDKPTRKKVLNTAKKDGLSVGEAERVVEKRARKTKTEPSSVEPHDTVAEQWEEVEDGPDEDEQAGALRASDAMHFAQIAISQLERIRDDDPLRAEAIARVRQWTEQEGGAA